MKNFLSKLKLVLKDSVVRRRILFTIGALVFFRFLSAIPVPGVDALSLQKFLSGNQLFGLLDIFSGGGISNLSIVMLGVGPYITASIIIQVMSMVFPSIKNLLHEEGEAGRRKLSQYSRMLSVVLAVLQSIGFVTLLQSQNIIPHLGALDFATNAIIIAAGSILLMWIGELVSEFGIGNGVSLIIFAGIIAVLPTKLYQLVVGFQQADIAFYALFLAIAIVVIGVVVAVTEAERPIPVHYAKQVRGNKVYGGASTYLPLRLNMAGVIPIIFALSILLIPQIGLKFLAQVSNPTVQDIANTLSGVLANQWAYAGMYFALVCIFTYFYTAITFDPVRISENLQQGGAFVPGVRPGEATAQYLGKIVTRITFVGALFLAVVAVLPLLMQAFTGNTSLAIGGTALLIVVSVVLDLVKRVDAQASMREY